MQTGSWPRCGNCWEEQLPMLRRRELLAGLAAATAAGAARKNEPGRETARDHFWIFTVAPGSDNDYLATGGIRGGSRMTPAEGAWLLGVPHMILVRERGNPAGPQMQKWRTRASFEQYATAFRPLKRVIWSVVGSGGAVHGDEIGPVLDL